MVEGAERFYKPGDQEIYCEIVPPTYNKETTLMKTL